MDKGDGGRGDEKGEKIYRNVLFLPVLSLITGKKVTKIQGNIMGIIKFPRNQ